MTKRLLLRIASVISILKIGLILAVLLSLPSAILLRAGTLNEHDLDPWTSDLSLQILPPAGLVPNSAASDLFWRTDGTSGSWTAANWSASPTATGGTGWTSGDDAFFTANSTVTFVTGTLFADVTLANGIAVTVSSTGTAAAAAHVYDIGTGSTLTWTGQNFTAAGTSFTKNGLGTWNIGVISNAYTGGFTLNAGTVIVSGNNSFGAATLAINGGTIQSSGGNSFAPTSLTIGGDFTFAGIGNDTWNGTVNIGASTRTITNNTTSTATRTFANVISGGAGAGLTFEGTGGSGGIVLGAANTYTGATTIDGGTLILDAAGGGSISSSSALVLGGGALSRTGNNQTSSTQTFNGTTINPGKSSISLSGGNGSNSPTLALGAITRNVGGTADFTLDSNGHTTTTTANDANGLLGAGLTVKGDDWATKSGSDVAAFAAYTTQNAVGSWTANQNITNSGVFTGSLGGNLTINSLRFNSNNATGPNLGSSTLTVLDGILITSTVSNKAETISGGSLKGSSGRDLVVINNGAGSTSLNISSNIIDNGSAIAFTKSGANLVTLSGASNSYAGATYVNEGTLAAGVATSAFGSNSAVVISTGATLSMSGVGFNETIGSLASNNAGGTGSVTLGANTLTTGGNNTSTTFGGVISGSGALQKVGSGIQTLSGVNTYTGATQINAGTLLVNGSLAPGSTVTVNNSGTVLGGSGAINGSVMVNGSAKIQGGNGTTGTTLTLAGNLTLNDNSIVQLALGPAGAHSTLARTGSGTWSFDSDQAFSFINVQAGTYDNIITGLASNPGSEATWLVTNPGWSGSFTYDGANIDLTLTAVPEPSTWMGGALAVGVVGWSLLKRRKAETLKS